MSPQRVGAVVRKEVREFRRNRFVISTMAVLPFVFLITPMITLFRIPSSASGTQVKAAVGVMSLLMLIVPIVIPPVIAAYSVVGERDQGTLEPVLTAPVPATELLLGKAAAAFVPSVGIAYAIYFVAAVTIRFFAAHVVEEVVWHPPQMLAQILFTPLLATWSIWVGIGISTRASDVRVAQQLATLAGLPLLAFTSLLSFQLITPSVPLAVGLALALLLADVAAWRVVSRLFDPERLLAGPGARRPEAARRGLLGSPARYDHPEAALPRLLRTVPARMTEVTLTVNGVERSAPVEPRVTLADFLRDDLGLTGTHLACEHGVCGACTVLLDGATARSCLLLAVQADGAEVTTIEGGAADPLLESLREAFRELLSFQCGFCTPGFLMTAVELLRENPRPTDREIREAISGNLCRCTGYESIVRGIALAAERAG